MDSCRLKDELYKVVEASIDIVIIIEQIQNTGYLKEKYATKEIVYTIKQATQTIQGFNDTLITLMYYLEKSEEVVNVAIELLNRQKGE